MADQDATQDTTFTDADTAQPTGSNALDENGEREYFTPRPRDDAPLVHEDHNGRYISGGNEEAVQRVEAEMWGLHRPRKMMRTFKMKEVHQMPPWDEVEKKMEKIVKLR